MEISGNKILYVSDANSPKAKDIFKKKNSENKFINEIYEDLSLASKLKAKSDIEILKRNKIETNNEKFQNEINSDITINSGKKESNEIHEIEFNIQVDKNENNLSINSNKIRNSGSIHFKDELKNLYRKNTKDKNDLISISNLNSNSSVSFNSENSVGYLNNDKNSNNREQTIDKIESIDYPITNRFKEVGLSKGNLLDTLILVNSKYFYDDISTKTINTCSINDDDLESDDDFEI